MNLSRIFVGLRERSAPLFGRHPSSTEAPVAQLDRAPDFESGGQGFESLPARHPSPQEFSEMSRTERKNVIKFEAQQAEYLRS